MKFKTDVCEPQTYVLESMHPKDSRRIGGKSDIHDTEINTRVSMEPSSYKEASILSFC